MIDQTGLAWEPSLWGAQPKWTVEPSSEAVLKVACKHLGLSDSQAAEASIDFLSQGGFNKLYTVTCVQGVYVMRVTLPVDPGYKTASEAATIDLLRTNTSVPVPRVLAFETSRDNPINFEWILMDRVPGITLNEAWPKMAWGAKVTLVEQIADAIARLFRLRSNAIGNVYHTLALERLSQSSTAQRPLLAGYALGRVVSMAFFWEKHIIMEIDRGPFSTSQDWIRKRLSLTESDCNTKIAKPIDEDDIEDAETTLGLASQLSNLMPKYFPTAGEGDQSEWCCLHHDDMNNHNILVDPQSGSMTGIVDWECVQYVPLWKACQLPGFLRSLDIESQPIYDDHAHNDDGTPDEDFLEHQRLFELSLLRVIFLERMAQIEASWIDNYRASTEKADFHYAVDYCDSEFSFKAIQKWLDSRAAGEKYYSLVHRVMNG